MYGLELLGSGIRIIYDGDKQSGECIIVLKKKDDVYKCLLKQSEKILGMPIDVLLSNSKEYLYLAQNNFVLKDTQKSRLVRKASGISEMDPSARKQISKWPNQNYSVCKEIPTQD